MKPIKILFVEPPRNYWFVMGEYLPPPSSLLILASYVEQKLPEVEIDIFDCQRDMVEPSNHLVYTDKPMWLVFSTRLTLLRSTSRSLSKSPAV